jgi:cytochrome c-type biogenesis protein CcmH/NrfG
MLFLNLTAAYLKLEKYKSAISSCDEAIKLEPNNTKALFRRAKALSLPEDSSTEDY